MKSGLGINQGVRAAREIPGRGTTGVVCLVCGGGGGGRGGEGRGV